MPRAKDGTCTTTPSSISRRLVPPSLGRCSPRSRTRRRSINADPTPTRSRTSGSKTRASSRLLPTSSRSTPSWARSPWPTTETHAGCRSFERRSKTSSPTTTARSARAISSITWTPTNASAGRSPLELTDRVAALRADWQRQWEARTVPVGEGRPKVGRNDPCPCGSGKKFKKCCLGKAQTNP